MRLWRENDPILRGYLLGVPNTEAYRMGFDSAVRATLSWGFATGDVDPVLMEHLTSLTCDIHDPKWPPKQNPYSEPTEPEQTDP